MPPSRSMVLAVFMLALAAIATSAPKAALAEKKPAALYAKQADWAETMVTSRASFLGWCREAGEEPGSSRRVKPSPAAEQRLGELWQQIAADFPQQAQMWERTLRKGGHLNWFRNDATETKLIQQTLARIGRDAVRFQPALDKLLQDNAPAGDPAWLRLYETVLAFRQQGRGPLQQIDDALAAMGDDAARYRKEQEQLLAAGAAPDDPRWAALAEKLQPAYSTYRKNLGRIKSLQKRLDELGPRAGEFRKRFDELQAAGTAIGDKRYSSLKLEVDQAFKDYAAAEARIRQIPGLLKELGPHGAKLQAQYEALRAEKPDAFDPRWQPVLAAADEFHARFIAPRRELEAFDFEAARRAIRDLQASFPDRYPNAAEYLGRLDAFEKHLPDLQEGVVANEPAAYEQLRKLLALQREALLSNPLLDFDRLLLVRRAAVGKMGLPQNWQGNCALPKTGYDNEIAVLSPVRPGGKLEPLYRPEAGSKFVGDVDLNFDADRLLFSMPGTHDRWQIWEIGVDGRGLRQVTRGESPSVDNYDACHLPDGRIIFDSTRCFHGVPCVGGNNTVANLCIMNADGSGVRQLCFDQDHDWCPTVLNNGRVLYSRWEYSDAPHYFTRLLFHMNPDGSGQMEYYGSNSPWPNSFFYARPVPGHPTKVVAVISGHHGVPRMGELLLFDPALGRQQADGAVQRIPGYGQKVEPVIGDGIVNKSWPRFLHPYPLSEKHFLVSCQPAPDALWGIYLVDVFDNMTLICQQPGYAMLEPVPLRKTRRPPIVPDRIDPTRRTAVVSLSDIYFGKGLADVPRGTVKKLRIYEQHYAYPKMGGHGAVGIDGPWDVKRILGTVPVESDGSASFRVPANTPLAVQPLDQQGRALQVMRSWFTAMPGEIISCVGCHESQNSSPPARPTLAMKRGPSKVAPWYGPSRGFAFKREIQPVLDRYCIGCHDGKHEDRPNFSVDGNPVQVGKKGHRFTPSYVALHPYVRRPGPESDYFMQQPLEFHAGTSELVQMLEKGHHNVKLDAEAWDRLATWIDLNVPDHGSWGEYREIAADYHKLRLEMRTLYANRPEDPEAVADTESHQIEFVRPKPTPRRKPQTIELAAWPLDADRARQRQQAVGLPAEAKAELAGDATLDLALIPPGQFVMGAQDGFVDERPAAKVSIERPFYLGVCEITNAQYACFDPAHDSAYISMTNKDHSQRGHPINAADQPAVRVNWDQASAFCRWLSSRTGKRFRLPTEAEWEWACRAGTDTPCWYGTLDADFGPAANLADRSLQQLARRDSPKWHPRDERFDDGQLVTAAVGSYRPNAWGLFDMHGNVAEWTRSVYRPYPYDPGDGREAPQAQGTRTVRGGSWYDRPRRATSTFRLHYPAWQRVYNVGFRVVMEVE